jgi:hypothetical protein
MLRRYLHYVKNLGPIKYNPITRALMTPDYSKLPPAHRLQFPDCIGRHKHGEGSGNVQRAFQLP